MENIKFNKSVMKKIISNHRSILLFSNDVMNISSQVKVPEGQNICCVDENGNVLWWIQKIPDFVLKIKPHLKVKDVQEGWAGAFHNNIWLEAERLKSFISEGYTFTIDLNSGLILDMESEKN